MEEEPIVFGITERVCRFCRELGWELKLKLLAKFMKESSILSTRPSPMTAAKLAKDVVLWDALSSGFSALKGEKGGGGGGAEGVGVLEKIQF